eukprot:scaffold195450_cov21-Tisochrysis_lutea.AAC.3
MLSRVTAPEHAARFESSAKGKRETDYTMQDAQDIEIRQGRQERDVESRQGEGLKDHGLQGLQR